MSDIPRPFKKSLPEYYEKEDRLLGMVYERFFGSGLNYAVRPFEDVEREYLEFFKRG